jgi:hypothetical protein
MEVGSDKYGVLPSVMQLKVLHCPQCAACVCVCVCVWGGGNERLRSELHTCWGAVIFAVLPHASGSGAGAGAGNGVFMFVCAFVFESGVKPEAGVRVSPPSAEICSLSSITERSAISLAWNSTKGIMASDGGTFV